MKPLSSGITYDLHHSIRVKVNESLWMFTHNVKGQVHDGLKDGYRSEYNISVYIQVRRQFLDELNRLQ